MTVAVKRNSDNQCKAYHSPDFRSYYRLSDRNRARTEDEFTRENHFIPLSNIQELEDEYRIEIALPGFGKEDIDMTLDHNILRIEAKKKEEMDAGSLLLKEIKSGTYKRSFKLSDKVDQTKINARLEGGILQLNISKKEELKARKILVNG